MSKSTESNLNEMMAGDGSALSMPPAFVFVNTRSNRAYKKKKSSKLISRISRRKKMKEELEQTIMEAVPSETERAQKQIGQMKKLNRHMLIADNVTSSHMDFLDKGMFDILPSNDRICIKIIRW